MGHWRAGEVVELVPSEEDTTEESAMSAQQRRHRSVVRHAATWWSVARKLKHFPFNLKKGREGVCFATEEIIRGRAKEAPVVQPWRRMRGGLRRFLANFSPPISEEWLTVSFPYTLHARLRGNHQERECGILSNCWWGRGRNVDFTVGFMHVFFSWHISCRPKSFYTHFSRLRNINLLYLWLPPPSKSIFYWVSLRIHSNARGRH